MTGFYRLAVVRAEQRDDVVVERGGRLLELAAVLTGQDLAALGGAPQDLSPLMADWPHWRHVLAARVEDVADRFGEEGSDPGAARFRPPLARPPKLICIGANYHDHVAEMPIPMIPAYPYAFLKPAGNTLRGSGETVAAPANVRMMDWEAELAVVIGQAARDVPAERALEVVAGYANFNDLSARDWLADRPPIGVDWVRHKAFDGFAPMGPYLVPAEFVPEPQDLKVQLWVNGTMKQDSTTGQMVFGVREIIEHLTSIMTLEPGDVIATGTPAGVGHGRRPPEYLQAGDEVRIRVGECGDLVTPIV